jgi:hypothetical protein
VHYLILRDGFETLNKESRECGRFVLFVATLSHSSFSLFLSVSHSLSLTHTQKLEKGQMAKDVSVVDEAPTVIVEEEQLLG